MNAQELWKGHYTIFHFRFAPLKTRKKSRRIMRELRREAALERKLAAAERKVDALIANLEYGSGQMAEDSNEWEKEYYSRTGRVWR